MKRKLAILAVGAFALGLQFGLPGAAQVQIDPVPVDPTWKCKRTTNCEDAFPDHANVECSAGLLKHCAEGSDADGCITCLASS